VLLVVEMVADKIPVLDSVNDVVHTLIRPAAGGLAFGAGSSAGTVTVTDPGGFPGGIPGGDQWQPVVAGIVIALAVHALKATARPVLNTMTAGVAAPVVSTAEDAASVTLSLAAILLPVLVVAFAVGLIALAWWTLHRRFATREDLGRSSPQ
jgi:hypothetical protein